MNPRCDHPGCGRQLFGRILFCFIHGEREDFGAQPFVETVRDTEWTDGTGRCASRGGQPARHCMECGKMLVTRTAARCMPCANRHTARMRKL